jgi:L-malate glycosyltransferase
MRIALLSTANAVHTVRWVNALVDRGIEIHLISAHEMALSIDRRIHRHSLPSSPPYCYLADVGTLRKLLAEIRPDLLHTHYASGYGTLARLSRFHPQVLSVWGSDVFEFPDRSPLHRTWLQRNLRYADAVCSTGQTMAERCRSLCAELRPEVIPFGVDAGLFQDHGLANERITIGTVKTLEPTYGIDVLIRGFAATRRRLSAQMPEVAQLLDLRIVGSGQLRSKLERLCHQEGIADVTTFVGYVPHELVPEELNRLDIYVAASRMESFGVAVLEASACERPVVVSDVGGLPEVVEQGVTGIVVPPENPLELAIALERLVLEPELRKQMGKAGRKRVFTDYVWKQNVSQMIELYEAISSPISLSTSRVA